MDVFKPFDDRLPRGFLTAKLHAYGLSEAACETICDHLKDRNNKWKS